MGATGLPDIGNLSGQHVPTWAEQDEWLYGLPGDENHFHLGGGQTEATLELAPGEHTIQMVFGDMNHVPFGPQMATGVIKITVK